MTHNTFKVSPQNKPGSKLIGREALSCLVRTSLPLMTAFQTKCGSQLKTGPSLQVIAAYA